MSERIPGIHHVTAIAGDAQRNVDFYTGVLGLRLVKRTVNFDDPGAYHLYFGDARGGPGTLLTFFPSGMARGRRGAGEVAATAFAVPSGSLAFWAQRLTAKGVTTDREAERLGESVLRFEDPDGTSLEMVETIDSTSVEPWRVNGVEPAHAIRGLHSATLAVRSREDTEALLVETMGLELEAEDSGRRRFRAQGEGPGTRVDVVEVPEAGRAELGGA